MDNQTGLRTNKLFDNYSLNKICPLRTVIIILHTPSPSNINHALVIIAQPTIAKLYTKIRFKIPAQSTD